MAHVFLDSFIIVYLRSRGVSKGIVAHGFHHGGSTSVIGDRVAVPYPTGDVREEDYP